ncbi:hypothetical protein PoB_003651500 [Plakobranchus ocellatus]|uniref:Uncharacterized protein n=1 Tax=Plakobranchus ocellatus TaxID=259542 RepID=A0AAV4ART5_9GAST|nr:hypothetical protein PoB_003651500 [Plakobranchus ocellatus]
MSLDTDVSLGGESLKPRKLEGRQRGNRFCQINPGSWTTSADVMTGKVSLLVGQRVEEAEVESGLFSA